MTTDLTLLNYMCIKYDYVNICAYKHICIYVEKAKMKKVIVIISKYYKYRYIYFFSFIFFHTLQFLYNKILIYLLHIFEQFHFLNLFLHIQWSSFCLTVQMKNAGCLTLKYRELVVIRGQVGGTDG